ncbi:DUF4407 domain-containing protein [Lacibacter luteus]|uniref:DUF4407 domain-containing protein n=1 Tax=Lacibacter luteus TaxID=2508719 RepID=A0A4Q1CIX8_9BACT|nr:DUF4407 domain-containing protein [Lacibacter luteus]RXK60039.1 DUF4407 domain-containing protein [Lacibacter luteus]
MEKQGKGSAQTKFTQRIEGLNKLLCRVAGSDLTILNHPKCSHEVSRHARIGAIIISTAVLATVSMFFALQTISGSYFVGIVAGIMWGMAIFVLDSYIIASYKKNDNKWIEFRLVLPRLLLAFVLGCSISIPMELKFFATEIADELVSMKSERRMENQVKVNREYHERVKPFRDEKEKLEIGNESLKKELESVMKEIASLNDQMSLEKTGKGLTQREGKGESYLDLEEQRNYRKNVKLPQIEKVNSTQIVANLRRIGELDSQIALIGKPIPEDIEFSGLSSQMDALKRLTSKNRYVLFAYWVFFFLILGMETAPIFVKFFSQKSSYDEILAMNEYEVFIEQQKRKSDIHQLINSEIEAVRSINEKTVTAQNAVNEKLMKIIAEAQGEIAEKAVRLWKLQQLKKIDENVEQYVESKIS